MSSALDKIEVLARKLAEEPNDPVKGATDFRAMEFNQRHEGHRQAGAEILEIIKRDRLTPERIKTMTNEELQDRIAKMNELFYHLTVEYYNRMGALHP